MEPTNKTSTEFACQGFELLGRPVVPGKEVCQVCAIHIAVIAEVTPARVRQNNLHIIKAKKFHKRWG